MLGTSEAAGTFTWNPSVELRNLPEPLPGTLLYLEPFLEPPNLPEPWLGTLAWNFGTCRNLYSEPLLRTSEPAGTFTRNPYLEPRNLPEPLLGTLLGTSELVGTFTWNPWSEPRNLLEPFMIRTLTWNLGTYRNLYLEPWLRTSEPSGTFTRNPSWNLGTCRNPAGWLPQSAPGPKLAAVGQ